MRTVVPSASDEKPVFSCFFMFFFPGMIGCLLAAIPKITCELRLLQGQTQMMRKDSTEHPTSRWFQRNRLLKSLMDRFTSFSNNLLLVSNFNGKVSNQILTYEVRKICGRLDPVRKTLSFFRILYGPRQTRWDLDTQPLRKFIKEVPPEVVAKSNWKQ